MTQLRYVIAGLFALSATTLSAADRKEPLLLQFTKEIAVTAGLGSLKNASLPTNSSEIRIWIGFGNGMPERALVLRINQNAHVEGEVLVHFPSDLTFMKPRDAKRFMRGIMKNCKDLRSGSENSVCTATFKTEPNWDALYKRLVSLGITTLPDESELPKPESYVLDGVSMVVEVLDGSIYRAYQYSNPFSRVEPEARSADQIMHAVVEALENQTGT